MNKTDNMNKHSKRVLAPFYSFFPPFIHSAMPCGEGSGLSGKVELRLMVVVMSREIWRYREDPKVEAVVFDSKREPWNENNLESFQGRSRIELGLGGWPRFRSVEGRREHWDHWGPLAQAALS